MMPNIFMRLRLRKWIFVSHVTRFLVDCGGTSHIVNYDSDFIFVDDNFNPERHFIELAER